MGRLMSSAACEEFSGVEQVLDPVQELSGLVCSQAFTVEGVEELLDQSVRDVSGQVRHWERLAVLWIGGGSDDDHRLIRLLLRPFLLVNDQ